LGSDARKCNFWTRKSILLRLNAAPVINQRESVATRVLCRVLQASEAPGSRPMHAIKAAETRAESSLRRRGPSGCIWVMPWMRSRPAHWAQEELTDFGTTPGCAASDMLALIVSTPSWAVHVSLVPRSRGHDRSHQRCTTGQEGAPTVRLLVFRSAENSYRATSKQQFSLPAREVGEDLDLARAGDGLVCPASPRRMSRAGTPPDAPEMQLLVARPLPEVPRGNGTHMAEHQLSR